MTYRRVLVLTELGADATPALAATRAVASEAERVAVGAFPAPRRWSGARPAPGPAGHGVAAWLDDVRAQAASISESAELGVLAEPDPEELDALVDSSGADLVVVGPRPGFAVAAAAELRRRRPVAVLWVPATASREVRPVRELLCVAVGLRARRAVAAFLRDHGDPAMKVALLAVPRPPHDEVASGLGVAGVRSPVELVPAPVVPPWRVLDAAARGRAIDLLVVTRFPSALLRAAGWPGPVLALPEGDGAGRVADRPLDVADAVDLGDVIRVRLGLAFGVGRNPALVDQEVAFVSGGRLIASLKTRSGGAEMPSALAARSLGVFRVAAKPAAEPVAAVERLVSVVRPGSRPLVLFDAELPAADLQALGAVDEVERLAVRMTPGRSVQRVRARLREAGLAPTGVVDASAVLADGEASDVGEALSAVRLARVALRLRAARYPVVAIVHRGAVPPAASGFAALSAADVGRRTWTIPAPGRRPASLAERLDALSGAARVDGNRVDVELDNATARRWLLEEISGARRRLHLQTYMVADDGFGRELEQALAGAASRGIVVRVLVDSLHGLHGSFGLVNPLLERLSHAPGVEVRVARPVIGMPSLEDLKLRDHRKLVVADGRVALLGGRNVAHEYYRSFHEVPLDAATPWRMVPWLDAGARVQGPAVAVLERSFLEAWGGAGGEAFEMVEPEPAGTTAARPVIHHGLRDAAALEAYLAIIDTARSSVDVVTGFPLALEVQHALLQALRRGVRVRTLFGNVTPTHGGEPFEGEWTLARTAGTWMVHSRMDSLVAAGAEGYELEVRDVPGWAPDLGPVHPHVHAKALCADGSVCAVGSANLDVTGSYWESELLLVVEDQAIARAFEQRTHALMAGSVRVDSEDRAWQRTARRREWLRHWPGVLSP